MSQLDTLEATEEAFSSPTSQQDWATNLKSNIAQMLQQQMANFQVMFTTCQIQLATSHRQEFASKDELASTRAEVADLRERIDGLARVTTPHVEQQRAPQLDEGYGTRPVPLQITGTRTTVIGQPKKETKNEQNCEVHSPACAQGNDKDVDDGDRYSSETYSQRRRGNRRPAVHPLMSRMVVNSMSRATVMRLPTDNYSLGPTVSYLTPVVPQDPRFRSLHSYRSYCPKDRSRYVAPDDMGHSGRWTKSLRAAMGNTVFTGNKPIKLLRWFEKFCTQCNGNEIPEATAVSMVPEFFSSPAHEAYHSSYSNLAGTQRPGTFDT